MKRVFFLAVLLGALIGLFGQQAAYAASVRMAVTMAVTPGMDADCTMTAQQAAQKQAQPEHRPCNGRTLDCTIAMAGVPALLVHEADAPLAVRTSFAVQTFWPLASVLAGSDPPPEQHPPSIPG